MDGQTLARLPHRDNILNRSSVNAFQAFEVDIFCGRSAAKAVKDYFT
jgi:hypothetical protein